MALFCLSRTCSGVVNTFRLFSSRSDGSAFVRGFFNAARFCVPGRRPVVFTYFAPFVHGLMGVFLPFFFFFSFFFFFACFHLFAPLGFFFFFFSCGSLPRCGISFFIFLLIFISLFVVCPFPHAPNSDGRINRTELCSVCLNTVVPINWVLLIGNTGRFRRHGTRARTINSIIAPYYLETRVA